MVPNLNCQVGKVAKERQTSNNGQKGSKGGHRDQLALNGFPIEPKVYMRNDGTSPVMLHITVKRNSFIRYNS